MENIEMKMVESCDLENMEEIVICSDWIKFDKIAISRFIDSKKGYMFMAKDNNFPVALACAYKMEMPDGTKPILYLHSIDVLERYRNKGIGTALLKYIIDFKDKNNFSFMWLSTIKELPNACKIYEKAGGELEKEGTTQIYYFK